MPRGRAPRAATPPCARCKTPGGRVSHGCVSPARIDGRKFGFDGTLCDRCHQRCSRDVKAGKPVRPYVPPPGGVRGLPFGPPTTTTLNGKPCARCGRGTRCRYDGVRFGFGGWLCKPCYDRLRPKYRLPGGGGHATAVEVETNRLAAWLEQVRTTAGPRASFAGPPLPPPDWMAAETLSHWLRRRWRLDRPALAVALTTDGGRDDDA